MAAGRRSLGHAVGMGMGMGMGMGRLADDKVRFLQHVPIVRASPDGRLGISPLRCLALQEGRHRGPGRSSGRWLRSSGGGSRAGTGTGRIRAVNSLKGRGPSVSALHLVGVQIAVGKFSLCWGYSEFALRVHCGQR